MTDFMSLLAAQMSNQDMMNPVSDTEFIAQMAQFSALQGVNTLQEYVLSSYAVSYAGKHVIISHLNETTNQLETVYGQVERITFMGGTPKVVVNGVEYDLHTVMEVSDHTIVTEDSVTVGDPTDGSEPTDGEEPEPVDFDPVDGDPVGDESEGEEPEPIDF
jgi:flagellar basal-body rod modification protein FlgD